MLGTSRRRWVLWLVSLLASFDEFPDATLRRKAAEGQLWQCDACGRVERTGPRRKPPRCPGEPENPHRRAKVTRPVDEDEKLVPTDNRHLFW
jgi:hypothetical protein